MSQPAPRRAALANSWRNAPDALRSLLARSCGRILRLIQGLVDLLGPTAAAARQSLAALVFNSSTSFLAGTLLAVMLGLLDHHPGALVLVPAAIGLRGNIFGSMGNRLSTAMHTGTLHGAFRPGTLRSQLRGDGVLAQNVAAAALLTGALSALLAAAAGIVAVSLGATERVSLPDLAFISVLGGGLASVGVVGVTLALARGAVRFGWDLDNLVAPSVSTVGDVLTVPALGLAASAVGHGLGTELVGWACLAVGVTALVTGLRAKRPLVRQIVRESLPPLGAAALLSTLAGVVIEGRLSTWASLPALLILEPAFVSTTGALGGVLSSRVSTNLHLGLVEPDVLPGRQVRRDTLVVVALAIPVFVFNAVGAWLVARLSGQAGPGLWPMLGASMGGGVPAIAFVCCLAYYGTVAAWRLDVDPDSYGLPIVTGSVDFVGAMAFMLALAVLGVG